MNGFIGDLEKLTEENKDFRRVIYTGKHMQLVLMAIKPGDEIGMETHHGHDQLIIVQEGIGTLILNGVASKLDDDQGTIIASGMEHNIINNGKKNLKLYTVYAPPEHAPGTVHKTKADADKAEEKSKKSSSKKVKKSVSKKVTKKSASQTRGVRKGSKKATKKK